MATNKDQIINQALRKAGLASSASLFGPEPEGQEDALVDLENMMAEWEIDGVQLGYIYAVDGADPDPSVDSGLPNWAISAVTANLAVRLLIDNLRPAPDELSNMAYQALEKVKSNLVTVPMLVRRNDMPTGIGNKSDWACGRFYHERHTIDESTGDPITP